MLSTSSATVGGGILQGHGQSQINDSQLRTSSEKAYPWRRRIHPEKIRNTLPNCSSGKNYYQRRCVSVVKTKTQAAGVNSL